MYLLINLFNFYFLKIFFILFHNCFFTTLQSIDKLYQINDAMLPICLNMFVLFLTYMP